MLGGVAITGGKGNIFGVIISIFIIGFLKFGMGLINVPGKVMNIIVGLLLILAIMLPELLKKLKPKNSFWSRLMKRAAFKMKLKVGYEEEYKKRHNEIWPELKEKLSRAGIYDYSIFLDKETLTLFAVQKIKDNNTVEELPSKEIMKKRWDYMKDIMETNPDNSPVTTSLEEVFHME